MIDQVQRFVLPQAYDLVPGAFRSQAATAMVLAIGLQESKFATRRQGAGGPARGFWQFEIGGTRGVMTHHTTKALTIAILRDLKLPNLVGDPDRTHMALEYADPLACVFARLLLWTLPKGLPTQTQQDKGFLQYLEAWRPKGWELGLKHPRAGDWPENFAEGWTRAVAYHARQA